MTATRLLRWARMLSALAGLTDTGTGLLLVASPATALMLMRVPVPAPEALIQVRFVGAFVTGVGACYLLALALGRPSALRAMLTYTLVLRATVGSFVTAACAIGWLAPAWLSVAATDLGLVVAQAVLLGKGVGRED